MAGLATALSSLVGGIALASPDPDPGPDSGPGGSTTTSEPLQVPSTIPVGEEVVSEPLVVVPAGCASPEPATVVFIGTLVATDAATARYRAGDVRAGSLAGYVISDQVDVKYDRETRLLEPGRRYLVGAAIDAETGSLRSRVAPPVPLFGGDAVVGVDDSDVPCPVLEDPVRTLAADGGSIDSGLFTPLRDSKGRILLAVARPFALAFAILVVLVVLKHLVFGLGRSLGEIGEGERPARPRRSGRLRDLFGPSGDSDQLGT